MNNETFLKKIENYFGVYHSTNTIELETWTDGGVNMFVILRKDEDMPYFNQFKKYIDEFDIDEEIEIHRQNEYYKSDFTIRESLEDFERYEERLNSIIDKLKN